MIIDCNKILTVSSWLIELRERGTQSVNKIEKRTFCNNVLDVGNYSTPFRDEHILVDVIGDYTL